VLKEGKEEPVSKRIQRGQRGNGSKNNVVSWARVNWLTPDYVYIPVSDPQLIQVRKQRQNMPPGNRPP
jgi:hypothetical protein